MLRDVRPEIGPSCGAVAPRCLPRFSDYLAWAEPRRAADASAGASAVAVTEADRFEPSPELAARLPEPREPRPAPETQVLTRTRVVSASPVGWFLDLLV